MAAGLQRRRAMSDELEQILQQYNFGPDQIASVRARMQRREERAPKLGDAAPDFTLPVLHGDGATVRLAALRGTPVALIFGAPTPDRRSASRRAAWKSWRSAMRVAF